MTDAPPAAAIEQLPELKHATVSPGGDRVAFYYTGTGRNEIHVLDLATGDCERLTDGDAGDTNIWPLAWTADGQRVLYHRDDTSGGEQYDVYAVDAPRSDSDGGRARDRAVDGASSPEPVVETDGSTQLRGVSRDGGALLVRSNHEGGMDAYLCDPDSGELTRLTDCEHPVYRPVLSPDGERVAYPTGGDVVVCDAAGDVERRVDAGGEDSTTTPVDWGPDGETLLVGDDATGVERSGVYDYAADDATWFGGDCVEEPQFLLPEGRRFLALRKRDALAVPVVYDAETGEGRPLDLPDGVAYFGRNATRVVDDGRVLVGHATPTRRKELLVSDLDAGEHEVVFEREYGPFEPADFADPTYERVRSDGVPATRQAAVDHDPAASFEVGTLFYDSGRRPSPLVVFPHGGPHERDARTFRPRVQYLCQRGYSVLQVNYRGSTGRGREFRRALYGDWGGAEQGDVATAVEHVLDAHEFLDEVAVYGGSFGGFSAYWQLVQYPDLYDAGVAVNGITDLEDMYANTVPQFRSGFLDVNLGTPEENPDLYRERSPVTHAANLDAPLLVVHGRNDPRVPVSQARRFRDALRDAGYRIRAGDDARGADEKHRTAADVEYHELDGSGHWEGVGGVPKPLALLDDFLGRRL